MMIIFDNNLISDLQKIFRYVGIRYIEFRRTLSVSSNVTFLCTRENHVELAVIWL